MNTTHLEAFVKVGELLNFGAAADELRVSQPTVSARIQSLEREIGVSLLRRTTRSVELTDAGRSLLADAKPALIRLTEGIDRARDRRGGAVYRVAYEPLQVALDHLAEALAMAADDSDRQLDFDVQLTDFSHKDALLLDGSVDCVLTVGDALADDPRVVFIELVRSPITCVMRHDHPLSARASLRIEDLGSDTLILLSALCAPPEMRAIEQRLREAHPGQRLRFTEHQLSGCALAAAGEGIAVMPDFVAVPSPGLVRIPVADLDRIRYGLAFAAGDRRAATRTFAQRALAAFGTAR